MHRFSKKNNDKLIGTILIVIGILPLLAIVAMFLLILFG